MTGRGIEPPSHRRWRAVDFLLHPEWEWLRIALLAPFLLFPLWSLPATAAAIVLWAALATVSRVAGFAAWPASPLSWLAALIAGLCAASLFTTPAPDLAIPKAAGVLLGWLAFRAVLFKAHDLKSILVVGLLVALVAAAWLAAGALATAWLDKFAFLVRLTRYVPLALSGPPGTAPEGVHPNAVAGTTLMILPALLVTLIAYGRQLESDCTKPGANWKSRVAIWTAVLVAGFLTLLLVLSQSRASWMSFCLALGSMWMLASVWARRIVFVLVIPVSAAVVGYWDALLATVATFGSRTHAVDVTLAVRTELWQQAVAAISDFPVTGLGLGAFRRVAPVFYPPLSMSPEIDFAHSHNVLLQTALDIGLPGLVTYLALVGLAACLAVGVARRSDGSTQALAIGLFGNLVALHAFGLLDAISLGAKVGLFFWLNLALIASLDRLTCRVTIGRCVSGGHSVG